MVVQEAKLAIAKTGPAKRYLGREATWEITVTNQGEVALTNVVVRDQLPAELTFVSASQNGQFQEGQVVWNLGTLQGASKQIVQVTTRCDKMTPRALNVATASASCRW